MYIYTHTCIYIYIYTIIDPRPIRKESGRSRARPKQILMLKGRISPARVQLSYYILFTIYYTL